MPFRGGVASLGCVQGSCATAMPAAIRALAPAAGEKRRTFGFSSVAMPSFSRAYVRKLIHIGRRTRRRRETVLEILEFRKEAPEMVVMSGFGHNANWLRNIEATSTAEVVVGSKRSLLLTVFLMRRKR